MDLLKDIFIFYRKAEDVEEAEWKNEKEKALIT